jgi:hypothetical protein
MKKLSFLIWIALIGIQKSSSAQSCTFVSPTVDILSTQQQANGDCKIVFNLAFDIITNSGNKIIFVHLWKASNYPSYNYNQGGNPPPTNATALSNTIVNVAIDNFGATPVLLTSYGPDNSVIIQSPSTNPAMTISKTTAATAGAERFIIKNISVTVASIVCGNSLVFTGDAWSSNSNASGAKVQCAMQGFAVGITDPLVDGACTKIGPLATYSFSISTPSATLGVYYDVYLDNGNNLLDPANDLLLTSVGIALPITITPATPFNSGPLPYPTQLLAFTRKIYVVVAIVGKSYLVNTEILQCASAAPVLMSSFTASPAKGGASLKWTTEAEQNNAGFEVQRQINGVYTSIAAVKSKAPGGNSSTALSYVYNDVFTNAGGYFYYRIKQTDFDGKISYSDVKKVLLKKSDAQFSVFPNPATGRKATVMVPAEFGKVDLMIFDAAGKLVRSNLNTADKNMTVENMQPGFYIVKLTNKATGEMYSEKLVVLQ